MPGLTPVDILISPPRFLMSSEPLIIANDGFCGLFVMVSGRRRATIFFTNSFQLVNFFSSAPNPAPSLQEGGSPSPIVSLWADKPF